MSMKRLASIFTPLALGSAVGGLGLSSAAAQDARQTDVLVSVETLYDSNVARSSAAVAAERGLSPSDVIVTPLVQINLARPFGRESAFLNGTAGYDFYVRDRQLNRERLDLHGGINGVLGRCQGALTDDFARHQSDLADLNLATVKNVESRETAGFNTICGRSVGFAPTVGVSETWDSNSAPGLLTSNYRSFAASGGLAYRRPTFGTLTAFGQFVDTDFPNRFIFDSSRPSLDGYHLYAGGVSFDRKIGGRLEGAFSLSYSSLEPFSPGAPGFNGPTYSTDLNFRATHKLQAHFNFSRVVLPSNRAGASFTVTRNLLLDATFSPTSRLIFTFGASRRQQQLSGAALIVGADIQNETLTDAFGTVEYKLNRRISLGLDGRYEERGANLSAFSYSEERFGFSVRGHF